MASATERPVQVLDRLPASGGLFARAVVGGLRKPGAKAGLPQRQLMVTDVEQDVDRLAAYDRICGYTLRDAVPATWLHILTFPLQLDLMTGSDFPFPAVGMVHVANRMRLHRPVLISERLTLAVHADHLRPHRAGAALDIVERASVGDELVWEGASTYLVRGAKAPDDPGATTPSGPVLPAPEDLPPAVATWRLPAGLGREYAGVSGDANPIHLNPLAAKALGFPRTIAHGMWSHAAALAALEPRLPSAYEVAVEFKKPVLLPSTVRFGIRGEGEAGSGWQFAVTGKDASRVHLLGAVTPA